MTYIKKQKVVYNDGTNKSGSIAAIDTVYDNQRKCDENCKHT